jgi:hypothetical protein
MKTIEEVIITPEMLIANGFLEFIDIDFFPKDVTIPVCSDLPEMTNGDRLFFQSFYHRNLISIVFDRDMRYKVYVQNDVGCGTTEMPFRWSELTASTLNHLYMAFMGRELFSL